MTTILRNSQRHRIEWKKEGTAKGYARGWNNTGLDDNVLLPCEGLSQHVRFTKTLHPVPKIDHEKWGKKID